jgi:probable addiction module antidote protein
LKSSPTKTIKVMSLTQIGWPKMKASRPHNELVVEMLKADPDMTDVYLATALEEANLPGGQFALLAALRHIAEAQGMASVAEKAGMPRESLYRALSPRGNPTIKTLLAVLAASGLKLGVTRAEQHA